MMEAVNPALKKRDRTRRHIYECAMRVFTDNGYASTTIGDICKAADISRATFFVHFKEKSALAGEASRVLGERWAVARHDIGKMPAHDTLRHLIWFIYDNMASPDIVSPMLDDFRHTFGSDTSHGTGPGTIHAYATVVISAAQAEGTVLADQDVEMLAHHALRLTSLYRIHVAGGHDETKNQLWTLFYFGAKSNKP